jgi:U3 small nucleolar RNA-associated protein 19
VASFVKRLARLSLAAPPSSAVMTIPFIYNMLKRHPSCMGMLHRPTAIVAPSLSDEDELDSDPYNVDEQDPLKTGAIDSSLWELKSLQRHYLSHVSTMGKIFEEVFTKPEFNLDDFLDHTYATVSPSRVVGSSSDLPLTLPFYLHSFSRRKSNED